jgi:hypothetical protein
VLEIAAEGEPVQRRCEVSRAGPNPPPLWSVREHFSLSDEAWQEWQGSAFARVRSRSLSRTKTLQKSSLSERARTGANVARTCHAEGRGFESHHPLLTSPARRLFVASVESTSLSPLHWCPFVPIRRDRQATRRAAPYARTASYVLRLRRFLARSGHMAACEEPELFSTEVHAAFSSLC